MSTRFGEFRFDTATRQLFRADVELPLPPKAFELLKLLIEHQPRALSKTELQQRLWPDTFVSEGNLPLLVSQIRAALGDRPRNARFIRTVQRYGYAFCGAATDAHSNSSARKSDGPTCWLVAGTARTPLVKGASVIGRDPGATIWLDLPGVSRQHARVVVAGEHVTVADLDSKNGTYVRGERIQSAVTVGDGDEIRVGPAAFTLRILSAAAPTQTE